MSVPMVGPLRARSGNDSSAWRMGPSTSVGGDRPDREGHARVEQGAARVRPVRSTPIEIETRVRGAVNVTFEHVDVEGQEGPLTIVLERAPQ